MTSRGYDRAQDGSFLGWWIRWTLVGILLAVAGFAVLVHVADVRVRKQKEYREQCHKHGPRDSSGDRVCDRGFMPSYTSSGPYFTADGGRPGS